MQTKFEDALTCSGIAMLLPLILASILGLEAVGQTANKCDKEVLRE
jgi:hypothetical protein